MVFDWIRKRYKNRKLKTLDYLINLEKDKQEILKDKIGETLPLEVELSDSLKDVSPIPYGTRLKKTRILVEVLYDGFSEIVRAKIRDEHWLKFKTSDRKKWKILIGDPPNVVEEEHKAMLGLISYRKRSMKFYVGCDAEATHNPKRTEYDIPVIENIVKSAKMITEGDMWKAAADQVKVKASFWEMFPYMIIALIVVIMIFAFQIHPNL